MSQLDLLGAQPVAAVPPPPPPPPPPPRPKPMPVVEEAPQPGDLRAELNPPGGTAYEAVGVAPSAPKAKRKPAKQVAAEQPEQAEPTQPEPEPVKAEQTQPESVEAEQTQPESVKTEQTQPDPVKAESGRPSPAGLDFEGACVLLVGCWARKGLHHRDVQEVVSEIAALLAKRAGVEHYCSGAPNEYRNPYRALAAVLAKRGLPPGVWTLDPAAPWAPEVLEVLRTQAIIVIEATR